MLHNSIIISIRDLRAGYGGPEIIRGVALDIRRSEMITFVGPNGAGKSTLLRALYGTAKATHGEIIYESEHIEAASPLERFEGGIAFVPQGRCNFPQMSVAENLEIAAHSILRAARHKARTYVFFLFPVACQPLIQSPYSLPLHAALLTFPDSTLVLQPTVGLAIGL